MDELTFRAVRDSDREDMFQFLRKTWDGNDYIPSVWEGWLTEKDSEFILGEVDGTIVGCARLNVLSPGEVWLEGLRVREEKQGRGYAWEFQDEILRRAENYNPRVLRFSTGDKNEASIHLAESVGFEKVEKYYPFYLESIDDISRGETSVKRSEDIEEWYKLLQSAVDRNAEIGNFLAEGWVFYEITPGNLRNYFSDNYIFYEEDDKGRLTDIISYSWCDKYEELNINIAFSESGEVGDLVKNTIHKLPSEWIEDGVFFCCCNENYLKILREFGFEMRFGDTNMLLFEKTV